ncbi:TetR/AcrR family transcriptional regulator [Paenibacillus sp. H1-7]|uniref:TetR/AcrR family transcriptional regulator n=1 Tax=Paenibacillus sp. H1-7 TaxID=2282849 RepID=UPI001EF8D45C|nr:TetR/AcrR family transcriptional regulator [Paenibacillus sp. H1-7]ULL18821.1 TetR/AcrR family transcriptional regulator [Paenibacillus sp. H1-7]
MDTKTGKSRQELRSEETRNRIREAAGNLFTSKGYDSVTMREIAKEAGCSHTTIYLYYKDKEAMLEQLALPPLLSLEEAMRAVTERTELPPMEALKEISRQFLLFCLSHKSMVTVIISVKSVRVDEADPESEVNKHRNQVFRYLADALNRVIEADAEEEKTNYTRIFFYMLHGMVTTYIGNEEEIEPLYARLVPILDQGIEIVVFGIEKKRKQDAKQGKKPKDKTGRK